MMVTGEPVEQDGDPLSRHHPARTRTDWSLCSSYSFLEIYIMHTQKLGTVVYLYSSSSLLVFAIRSLLKRYILNMMLQPAANCNFYLPPFSEFKLNCSTEQKWTEDSFRKKVKSMFVKLTV